MGYPKQTFTNTVVLYGKPHPVVVQSETPQNAVAVAADLIQADVMKATAPTASPDTIKGNLKTPANGLIPNPGNKSSDPI